MRFPNLWAQSNLTCVDKPLKVIIQSIKQKNKSYSRFSFI